MQADTLIIATRESRLALWQARHVQHLLSTTWNRPVELLGMTTRGDQILDRALSKVGGKGLFVKELEVAMEEGRAHLAVHSLKDVPMEMPEGFVLAAVLEREDPRDAWVSSRFQDVQALPQGGRVGTSSLRRMVQLRQLRPDLQILPLRGNLDTRLRKLDEGEFDGIVLAAAGLRRLGLADRIRSVFDTDILLPAAGQGALGIEVRLDAAELASAFQGLIDVPTWLAVHAERAVSRTLGGSCSVPLAAFAEWQADGQLRVRAALGHPGSGAAGTWPLLRAETLARVESVQQAEALGVSVAQELLAMGGRAYLDAASEPSASA